jgi:hypothetical protein
MDLVVRIAPLASLTAAAVTTKLLGVDKHRTAAIRLTKLFVVGAICDSGLLLRRPRRNYQLLLHHAAYVSAIHSCRNDDWFHLSDIMLLMTTELVTLTNMFAAKNKRLAMLHFALICCMRFPIIMHVFAKTHREVAATGRNSSKIARLTMIVAFVLECTWARGSFSRLCRLCRR